MLTDGNFVEFEKLLKENPTMIDSFQRRMNNNRMFYSWSLLINAAVTRDMEIFLYLLKHKPDLFLLEISSRWNVCFLITHYNSDEVALRMMEEMCKLLNPNEKSELFNTNDDYTDTPMHYAAMSNVYKTIEFMSKNGGNLNALGCDDRLPGEHDMCDRRTVELISKLRLSNDSSSLI